MMNGETKKIIAAAPEESIDEGVTVRACANCALWVATKQERGAIVQGACMFDPPTMHALPQQTLTGTTIAFHAMRPNTAPNETCGRHRFTDEPSPHEVEQGKLDELVLLKTAIESLAQWVRESIKTG